MARQKGSLNLSGAIEAKVSYALDARAVVKTKQDLLDPDSFPYKYIGMITSVQSEQKAYMLIANDTTQEASWKELGAGGGSGGSGGGSVDLTGYAKLTDLPENVSDLTNDSGFQTATEVDSAIDAKLQGYQPSVDLTQYAKTADIPSNVSQLTNDSGYQDATQVDNAIDAKLQGYQPSLTIDSTLDDTSENPVQNKVIKNALDAITATTGNYDYLFSWNGQTHDLILNEGTSDEQKLRLSNVAFPGDIPNLSGFAKTADLASVATSGDYEDLINKPAPYDDTALTARIDALEQSGGNVDLSDYYTKDETDNIISGINSLELVPVPTLPTQNIRTDCIYLVKDSLVDNNLYSEWVYIDGDNGGWEKFGSANIDISGYVTEEALASTLADYAKRTDVEDAIADAIGEKVDYAWEFDAENKCMKITDVNTNQVMTIPMTGIALMSDVEEAIQNITPSGNDPGAETDENVDAMILEVFS